MTECEVMNVAMYSQGARFMRVVIHQPQFLPWLGYLDKIDQSDCFVILDNVQFKKNEWQNRNRIRTAQGWQWVTVPVLHSFGQLIREVRINQSVDWKSQHLRAFQIHYGKLPYFHRYFPQLWHVYNRRWEKLTDLTVAVLHWLLETFEIDTPIRMASEMNLREDSTERLIDVCKGVGATTYLAGAGATGYMDLEKFENSGFELEFQTFQHPQYVQRYHPFMPGMCALDLLFNCGAHSINLLREGRCNQKEPASFHFVQA